MKKTGEIKRLYREFCWPAQNPGWEGGAQQKSTFGTMVDRHAAVQLSIGKVTLGWLRDANREHKFLFVDDREPVARSFRGILLNMKVEGRKF